MRRLCCCGVPERVPGCAAGGRFTGPCRQPVLDPVAAIERVEEAAFVDSEIERLPLRPDYSRLFMPAVVCEAGCKRREPFRQPCPERGRPRHSLLVRGAGNCADAFPES